MAAFKMLTLCQIEIVLRPTQKCSGYVNFVLANRPSSHHKMQNASGLCQMWSQVLPIKRGMRSTLKSRKTLQDWLENSAACNRDGASRQFCIEHITWQPNLTKFSQKRSVENAFSKPVAFSAVKHNFQLVLGKDCALIWALRSLFSLNL